MQYAGNIMAMIAPLRKGSLKITSLKGIFPKLAPKAAQRKIYVIGVSHILANTLEVIDTIEKIILHKTTINNADKMMHNRDIMIKNRTIKVFLEPKISLVTGSEKCMEKSINDFFNYIISFIKSKKLTIVPLNPSIMPSHKSTLLYHKIAMQFAEEEYMADIIATTANDNDIVIIGNNHAERLCRLLKDYGVEPKHVKVSPETPEDILTQSWRNALEGHSDKIISLKWLKEINEKLRTKLMLPEGTNIQKTCWSNPVMFSRYIALSRRLVQIYPPENYLEQVSEDMQKAAIELSTQGTIILNHYKNTADHMPIAYPYS